MAKAPIDLRSLARAHTVMGLKVLATIAQRGKSESARVSAVALLLERGWGKAPATIAGENGEGDVRVVIRHILEGSSSPRPITKHINGDNTVNTVIEHNRDNTVIK